MVCPLAGVKLLAEPMPMNIVNWTIGNKLQWNLKRNSYNLIQEKTFQNVVYEMAAILAWPQCGDMRGSTHECTWLSAHEIKAMTWLMGWIHNCLNYNATCNGGNHNIGDCVDGVHMYIVLVKRCLGYSAMLICSATTKRIMNYFNITENMCSTHR